MGGGLTAAPQTSPVISSVQVGPLRRLGNEARPQVCCGGSQMRRRVALVLLVLGIPAAVRGQGVRPLSVPETVTRLSAPAEPKSIEAKLETKPDVCDAFLFVSPPNEVSNTTPVPPVATLRGCIDTSAEAARNARSDETVDAEALVQVHVNYKQLKRWVSFARSLVGRTDPPSISQGDGIVLQKAINSLDKETHAALEGHGLRSPLTAMLFTGAAFGDTPAKTGTSTDAKKAESNKVAPSAAVLFESPHFNDDEHPLFHYAFGGRIGFQQIMTMMKPTGEGVPANATPVGEYKDGLLWNFGASVYSSTTGRSEAYVRVSTGGTRVGDFRTVVTGENGQGFISNPVDNDTSQTAPRWEVGFGWNYYGVPMELIHLEKSLLNPLFSTYVMRRHDERYKKRGDLAAFNNPELRWVYGFSVNLKSFLRSDGVAVAASKPNTFDFGFAVEREIARGSGLTIPSNTRYVIRGEMNLLRAFAGTKPS